MKIKFVPMSLYKYLAPNERCEHLEKLLEKANAKNSECHEQIIQLGKQIIQLSGELEETELELEESKSNWADMGDKCQELSVELNKTKQLLEASKNKADHFEGKVLHLTDVCSDRNREREILSRTLEAHRDAFREVVNTLTKLGAKDPHTDG